MHSSVPHQTISQQIKHNRKKQKIPFCKVQCHPGTWPNIVKNTLLNPQNSVHGWWIHDHNPFNWSSRNQKHGIILKLDTPNMVLNHGLELQPGPRENLRCSCLSSWNHDHSKTKTPLPTAKPLSKGKGSVVPNIPASILFFFPWCPKCQNQPTPQSFSSSPTPHSTCHRPRVQRLIAPTNR